jgi:hypothetical protein
MAEAALKHDDSGPALDPAQKPRSDSPAQPFRNANFIRGGIDGVHRLTTLIKFEINSKNDNFKKSVYTCWKLLINRLASS